RRERRQPAVVEAVAPHAFAAEQLTVVGKRRMVGQQPRWEGAPVGGRHERHRQHPQQRKRGAHRQGDQQRVHEYRGGARFHAASARRVTRSCRAVIARINRNSRKETAEAEPRFHHLKPSSYMKYSTLTVLCIGPPCVITYGSANSWKYPATVRMLTSSRVGRNIGSVMRPNSCQRLAPSRRAASYTPTGTLCSAAM